MITLCFPTTPKPPKRGAVPVRLSSGSGTCHVCRMTTTQEVYDEQRTAQRLCRGVRRLLWTQRYASLTEFPLANGRRADIFGVTDACDIVIVEVKSSIVDFRTDQKWPEYRAFCDAFFFAVGTDFPTALIPDHCGLIV